MGLVPELARCWLGLSGVSMQPTNDDDDGVAPLLTANSKAFFIGLAAH